MQLHRTALSAAAALALAAPASAVPATAKEKIVIVVDSSGSMAQRAGGRSRMAAARAVIGDLVDGWDKDTELGLIAYGHRRKGACDDIQVIVPVGKVRPRRIRRAVSRLRPVGKTPLSASVRRAAELLEFTEDKATVILISDGKENCKADPCALGRELERKGVDFTAHVIGFDVRKSERAGLRCLAENTGGRYADAANPDALEKELAKAVEEKPKTGGPLTFQAVLAEGGEPLKRGVTYRVYRDDNGKRGDRVKVYRKARPAAKLKPGRYIVRVRAGQVRLRERLTIDGERRGPLTFVLNAGYATFKPYVSAEADEPLKRGVKWRIRGKGTGFKHTEHKARATVLMPAGDYTAKARWGKARQTVPFTVTAGERVAVKAVLGAGILVLDAVYAEGGPPVKKGGKWTIYEAKASLSGKRERVAREYGAKESIRLPAGDYVGRYRKGDATAEFKATVAANQRTAVTANLDAGVLALSAKLSEVGAPAKKLRWRVYKAKKSLDGSRTRVGGSRKGKPMLILDAGDYFIRVRYRGGKKKRFGTATASVTAGERTEATVTVEPAPKE